MTASSNSQTVTSRFLHIAQTYPENIALKWHDGKTWQQLSYRELLTNVRATAAVLAGAGVVENSAVILPSQRHADLCTQMLAILFCGGHYVFVDPGYPQERQQFIAKSAGATVGLRPAGCEKLDHLDVTWISPDPARIGSSQPECTQNGELPAYVMFTSGSTGEPKGVVVPHRAILRLVVDTDFIDFSPEQTFLQLSALSFDASTLEIWGALLNGGTCVLHPENDVPTPTGIRDVIQSQDVTTVWLTASLFNTFISEYPDYLRPLRQLLTGGESLSVPHVRKALECLPDTALFNGYGPTENTTFTTVFPIPNPLPADLKRIPIGFPIHGTECAIVDEQLEIVHGADVTGELVAFGDGLALGYLNRPELTAERFVRIAEANGQVRTGYRTGDLVLRHDDGSYDYLSRIDKQVKIDGHRIEPGEIEYQLNNLPGVNEARVIARVGPTGQKRLAAYVVCDSATDSKAIRSALASVLPAYMVPHFIIEMTELPKNRNGKLDESRLPDPYADAPSQSGPSGVANAKAVVMEAWRTILERSVQPATNFMDAGGTSLEALKLANYLEKAFGIELSATFVFEYPTAEKQAEYLAKTRDQTSPGESSGPTAPTNAFAIIGIACRFPGARNVNEYWQNLLDGRETISFFTDEELSPEVSAEDRSDPAYVKAKGILDGYDQFDARFFGVSPIEARVMDPQQRIMLELCWHALEDAAIPPGDDQYRTGVFAGMNWARYYQQYVLPNRELVESFGALNCGLANEPDLLSTRVSYKLNLKGPSVNVFTACSTGLVAVAQACEAIENGQCEQAIAAGVSISTPVKRGYLYQEGSMLSRDGHCRPFDEQATGTTFNDGAGAVILKRLDLAERDGDNIYAVIKGYAINNDGEEKASFTAPSVAGQVAVYQGALNRAGVPPESIGFIETHGTATPLGDPIEVLSLRRCYSEANAPEKNCAIGSVKSNIGHAIHAAGLASLIKTALAVREDKIPPTLFFQKANPKLELEKSRFFVNDQVTAWKLPSPRRAAVTSLGVGGTNAHVVLEEYRRAEVAVEKSGSLPEDTGPRKLPLVVSAKSKEGLDRQIARYQAFFADQKPSSFEDVCFTSITGRKHFEYRAAAFGESLEDVLSNLVDNARSARGKADCSPSPQLGFLFSGQGTQAAKMGQWLYQNCETYRDTFDSGCEIVLGTTGVDVRGILDGSAEDADNQLNQTAFVQPALFLLEYGLARYLTDLGIRPDFLIGHSIGEYAAAALSGIFSFKDAVTLVANRGALMQSMPPGRMLIVRANFEDVAPYLDQRAELAAANAPGLIVLSGETDAISALAEDLTGRKIASTLLQTSHAFHSSMMEPVVSQFESLVASVEKQPPSIPIVSTLTGALLSDQDAISPRYWAQQLRQPVMFSAALKTVQSQQETSGEQISLLEVGPGNTLVNLVGYHRELKGIKAYAALPGKGTDDTASDEVYRCIGQLWAGGYNLDWQPFFRGRTPCRTRLPGYAFAEDRHWLDPVQQAMPGISQPIDASQAAQTPPLTQEVTMDPKQHSEKIRAEVLDIIEDVSGYELGDADPESHFSEVGLDSLLLTQVATALERRFKLGITFRHLVETYTSLALIAEYIASKVEPDTVTQAAPAAPPQAMATAAPAQSPLPAVDMASPLSIGSGSLQDIVNAQLQIMQLQLQALGRAPATASSSAAAGTAAAAPAPTATSSAPQDNESKARSPEPADTSSAAPDKPSHTPGTRITRERTQVELTSAQRDWIDRLMARYQEKFAGSKSYTQKHRKHLADPRSVSGFNPAWKEIIFPIVTVESKGSKLWDIDGNELIDTSNGFGPILFGHGPDFISNAAKAQIDRGIETGPQSPLAGEVAELVCELTGSERCTFACTGSEANVGALRVARTVTGRTKVVAFEGAYHGIHDEVVMRAGKNHQALPAAPGIPREATSNMILLPWGEQSSLEEIRKLGDQLAAVLVEPVQSRKPQFHSKEYLQELRRITSENGVALILDEVVTGFRAGPGGIRRRFEIDADMTTYGKVVGGGYPIGIIAGKARFLDAMDGGQWQYGDDSIPEQGVTFFAGTFVRHPLALAVAKAVLTRIKEDGERIYPALEEKTSNMAAEAKAFIAQMKANVSFEEFASLFYISVPATAQWGHLLFLSMVLDGIHIQQYRPNFLTTEHSEADVRQILKAFKSGLANLIANGLMEGDQVAARKYVSGNGNIPPGARLGKNEHGEPAYFIEDPENKGAYLEVGRP